LIHIEDQRHRRSRGVIGAQGGTAAALVFLQWEPREKFGIYWRMQLTDGQLGAILAWAERTPEIEAVLLYGSRVTGTAKPDADVDLALVMTTDGFSGKERTVNYLHNFESWEADLEAALGQKAHLVSFDPVLGSEVQAYVAAGNVELWRRDPQAAINDNRRSR
jgi:predicted nucleotidyltransferase